MCTFYTRYRVDEMICRVTATNASSTNHAVAVAMPLTTAGLSSGVITYAMQFP